MTRHIDINDSVKNRFFNKIYYGLDGCWYWTDALNNKGYGCLCINKKAILSHRISFLIHNPNIDIDNMLVCHKCDNPLCVNPDHLFLGTHKDNTTDMINKGRSTLIFNKKRKSNICAHGHILENPNIYIIGDRIICKICTKETSTRNYIKRKLKKQNLLSNR